LVDFFAVQLDISTPQKMGRRTEVALPCQWMDDDDYDDDDDGSNVGVGREPALASGERHS
jgi:hypothetical protein